jgi:hypothetical protein
LKLEFCKDDAFLPLDIGFTACKNPMSVGSTVIAAAVAAAACLQNDAGAVFGGRAL